MKQVYIIDYIRTPIAKFQGGLSEVRADDLATIVLKEIVKRNPQIPAEEIEDVILGCANQAGEDNRTLILGKKVDFEVNEKEIILRFIQ